MKRLIFAQQLRERAAIKTAARPITMEEEKRRTIAFGLECNQRRCGFTVVDQFGFVFVVVFLIEDRRQFLDG